MPDAALICCCKAVVWTRVVGWLQIIFSILYVVICSVSLATFDDTVGTLRESRNLNEKTEKYFERRLAPEFKRNTDLLIVFKIICIVQSALTLGFAILLLTGISRKRPSHLTAWMVFTVVTTLTYIGAVVIELKESEMNHELMIGQCILVVMVRSFIIWVVFTFKQEMEAGGSMGRTNAVYLEKEVA